MSLTAQQQAAAFAPGSVAVLAGAGSGKTHMLVARYLKLLDTYSPLEIPAVTFTEAGAAELRARVRQEVARRRPGDVETLAELEAAQISTIHALCGRIVRDHPAAAGVRPDARVMDEGQTRLWLARHFHDALGRLPRRLFAQLPFSQMASTLRVLLNDPLLAEQALSIGTEHWGSWTRQAQDEAREQLLGCAEWQAFVNDLQCFQGADTDRMEQARVAALECVKALERGEDVPGALAGLRDIKLTGGSAKQWPGGGLDVIKNALKGLRERAVQAADEGILTHQSSEADDWLRAALPDLREAFFAVRDDLAELKRRAGLLDFSDLEVCALRALRGPAVVAHYAERWKAFLIDEAQDNNPVQAEILEILSGKSQRTLVGDLKQSIYGFRRAAPDLFQATSDRIATQGGQQVTLNLSFRTHQGLIEATNRLFHSLLGQLHSPLEGVRPGPDHPTLEAWHLDEVKPKALARQAEAQLIAEKVQAMVTQEYRVYDKGLGQERPLRPGDVAVLTRGWAALEPVRRAFLTAGLPVQDIGSGSLLLTQEAQDALALLSALALHDPAAIVTALRSPLLAVRDPVIHELAQAAGNGNWLTALLRSEHPELAPARQLFGELRRRQRFTPPSDLLLLADRLSGYTAVLANLWDSERRLADWRGFVDLVRELERGEDDTFSVVRELRAYLAEGVDLPRPPLEGRDAVTLTTMHSSKGLEWPLVIVADLNWSAPPGTADVLLDARLGVGLRGPSEEVPVLHTLIAAERTAKETAETRRLLYVALTRARDHLMLSANGPGKKGSLLSLLTPGLGEAGVNVALLDAPPLTGALAELPALPTPPQPAQLWTEPFELSAFSRPSSAPVMPAPDEHADITVLQDSWEELYDLLDPRWVEWARGLASAGIPAPGDVHVDIPIAGRVSGQSALMIWNRPVRDVILAEGMVPTAGAVTVSLTDSPAAVAERLRPLLEEA